MDGQLEFLKEIGIFQAMSDEELLKISNLLHEETFPAEKLIFNENETGTKWYFVKSGIIKISKKSEKTGKDEFLAMIREKEFFGEMAVLDDSPRCATATAKGDSILLSFKKEDFKKMVEENSALTLKIYRIFISQLCKKLREMDKQMVDSFFTPPPLSSAY